MAKLACLILAAGEGRRFGGRKQLAHLEGKPLIRHTLDALTPLFGEKTFVVLGAYEDEVRPHVEPSAQVLAHDNWKEGIGSSLGFGVQKIQEMGCWDGVLVALADQIRIKQENYRKMMDYFAPAYITAAHYADQSGVPILFPHSCFARLEKAQGNQGAKKFLKQLGMPIKSVDLPEAAYDVDTPADLKII